MSTLHKPSGILITTPHDGSQETVQHTVSCCHCQHTWVPRRGSGRRRGICLSCHGVTCGSAECDTCVHFEQKLENLEAGRPLLYKPITVTLSGLLVPGG